MKNLQIKFENLESKTQALNVILTGRLNEMNAIDFKDNLMKKLRGRESDCVIDIKNLTALDIIGLNALAMAHREIEKNGQGLAIISADNSKVDRAFKLTKFDRILNLVRA